ncbi:hypothetical protein Vafri_19198 [Volvox africanus]|uniref:Uncharacterized protein n=1 Tax=Volvox africanus TaxID=51714 RepID=A0A8J4FCR3_9CHLO|nr:hypothetical protein Vafri_19198 [Volvox africanus]
MIACLVRRERSRTAFRDTTLNLKPQNVMATSAPLSSSATPSVILVLKSGVHRMFLHSTAMLDLISRCSMAWHWPSGRLCPILILDVFSCPATHAHAAKGLLRVINSAGVSSATQGPGEGRGKDGVVGSNWAAMGSVS